MASSPVYIGRWTDYTRSGVLGDVITLDVRMGAYLLAALSTFVGFVGTATWSLLALWIHQSRAGHPKQDGLYFQHQAIYRNAGSAPSSLWTVLRMCWAWRRKDSEPRVRNLKRRSFAAALAPLFVFVAFTAAGILVSEVAGKAYRSNNVLLRSERCGFLNYQNSTDGGRAYAQKILNDTIAGRAYATSCYDPNNSTSSASCNMYPVPALPFDSRIVKCPFGQDPVGDNLCLWNDNNAYQLDTPALDSSIMFGINAAPENRITIQKRVTCSPLHTQNYVTVRNTDYANYYFNLGEITDISNYTYYYPTHTKLDNVGYQVTSIYAGEEQTYKPVDALRQPTGDLSLFFLASNSIAYYTPVDDLWFAAHDRVDLTTNSGVELAAVYYADKYVYVMGCVDQYQMCNPNTNPPICSIFGKRAQVSAAMPQLGLNPYQEAAALRVTLGLEMSSTYNSVNQLGPLALQARNRLVGLLSNGLEANQWQLEVEGWFKTSLAKLQTYMTSFVTNEQDMGPYISINVVKATGNPVDNAGFELCKQQRVHNTGGYQTFSFVGLMIVLWVGCTIIVLSWIVEPILGCMRSLARKKDNSSASDHREIARVADKTLQLQRMVLMSHNRDHSWDKVLGEFPVTKTNASFAPPRRQKSNGMEDYTYGEADALLHDIECADNLMSQKKFANSVRPIGSRLTSESDLR